MNDTSQALLNLLERILGKGDKKSKGNFAFKCPNNCHPTKKKLEINVESYEWACWICRTNNEKMSGKSIKSLLSKLKLNEEYFKELKLILPNTKIQNNIEYYSNIIQLPKEFTQLKYGFNSINKTLKNIYEHKALKYLQSRRITKQDIIKYNIGFCYEGNFEGRIIIPSYDEYGKLNYFIARDFTDAQQTYKNPTVKNNDIIGMELYINWNLPIILCEGMFDMLIAKRNCIPLFGKKISNALMKKIVTSKVNKIYIALDNDAIKDSLKHCEELMKIGKEIYLVEMSDKDINKAGFENFLEILENTHPMTFQKLIEYKLK